MNNSISFRRTVLYARKHYVENARYYGYGLLAILILLSVFAWFYGSWRSDPGEFDPETGERITTDTSNLPPTSCSMFRSNSRKEASPRSVNNSRIDL